MGGDPRGGRGGGVLARHGAHEARAGAAREYARGARTRLVRAVSREDEHATSPTWVLAHDARIGNARHARARF